MSRKIVLYWDSNDPKVADAGIGVRTGRMWKALHKLVTTEQVRTYI